MDKIFVVIDAIYFQHMTKHGFRVLEERSRRSRIEIAATRELTAYKICVRELVGLSGQERTTEGVIAQNWPTPLVEDITLLRDVVLRARLHGREAYSRRPRKLLLGELGWFLGVIRKHGLHPCSAVLIVQDSGLKK